MKHRSRIAKTYSRRQFLKATLAGGTVAAAGLGLHQYEASRPRLQASTWVTKAENYRADFAAIVGDGLRALGVGPEAIKGRTVLLKPNLVETQHQANHINTHPLVVRGAAEAFLRLGAEKVLVGEGPGHMRDTILVLEESGLADVLYDDRIPFLDLNYMEGFSVPNLGRRSSLATLTFPEVFRSVDWIVSMPKLKTHHWAGVTLSMKNLFGVMPGNYYGWPKNVLHHAGLLKSIVDITATLKPHFAIVDGIVGMDGDGPIMGNPIDAGVLVMGRNLPAVDATCARLMGINPHNVPYLETVSNWLGPIREQNIEQVGETLSSMRKDFELLDEIPAQRNLRLS